MMRENGKGSENKNECGSTEEGMKYNPSVAGGFYIKTEGGEGTENDPAVTIANGSINCHDLSTRTYANDIVNKHETATNHENDIVNENVTENHCVNDIADEIVIEVSHENASETSYSYSIENFNELETPGLPQDSNLKTAHGERGYPKRSRNNKLESLENFYINDEILEHEIITADDEEDMDKLGKRKNLKSKRRAVDSDSDDDYIQTGMDYLLETNDAEEHIDAVETNDTENENEKLLSRKKKAALINAQIEKYKNILTDKGLQSKIPQETEDRPLLLAKLKIEANLAERIKVHLNDHSDKFEMKTFTSIEQKNRKINTPDKSFKLFSCKVCNLFQTKGAEKIRFHIEQHVNGEMKCSWCTMEFPRIHDKNKHLIKYHPEKRKRKSESKPTKICELCGHKGVTNAAWRNHMFTKHGIPSFVCKFCLDKFSTETDLNLHLKQTDTHSIISCNKCGKAFQDMSGCTKHAIRCAYEMPMVDTNTCHLCGKTMGYLPQLKLHIRLVHNREKLYQCELCPYSCFTTDMLKRHMDAHLGKDVFVSCISYFNCFCLFYFLYYLP